MNNIDILNNIMEPYFKKKAEIEGIPTRLAEDVTESKEKLSDLRRDRLERKKALQIELEALKVRKSILFKEFEEKRAKEIEEYISAALSSDSNFYSNYGSMLRKDLERTYDKKLQELEEQFKKEEERLLSEIKELSAKSAEEKEGSKELVVLGNRSDYTNVYLREMVELKDDLRIKLFAERKRLQAKLEELLPAKKEYDKIASELSLKQSEFKGLIDEIAGFKYEYNEQNQVVNIEEINELHEQRKKVLSEIRELSEALTEKASVIPKLNELTNSLEKVEEYIRMTELTKEETRAVMMSMTSWEKEEYERRKSSSSNSSSIVRKVTSADGKTDNPDMLEVTDPVVSSYEIVDGKVVVDTKVDLLKAIFNDIISEVRRVRSVKINPSVEELGSDEYYISTRTSLNNPYSEAGTINLYKANEEPMQLPNGEYVYSDDMKEAVDNYYAKNKGKTYVVRSTGKEYKVNLGSILKFKSSLKFCSALKLVKEKKVPKIHVTRIFGRQKGDIVFSNDDMGTIYGKKKMPEGEYINRNELIAKLNNLFTTKKLEWLKELAGKLKGKEAAEELVEETKQKEQSKVK